MKAIKLIVIFTIILWGFYVNVYPPIFELRGTYLEYYSSVYREQRVQKNYLIQNPPKNSDDLKDLVKEYLFKTVEPYTILNDQIDKYPDENIWISVYFYRKNFVLHRFWRPESSDDLTYEPMRQYVILAYHLEYNCRTRTCTESYHIYDPYENSIEENTFKFVPDSEKE